MQFIEKREERANLDFDRALRIAKRDYLGLESIDIVIRK